MRFIYIPLLLLLLSLLFLLNSCGDNAVISAPTPAPTFTSEIQVQIEQIIEQKISQYNIPCVITGIWIPGEGTWIKAKGKSDLQTGRDALYTDRFRIASITKTFTITIILQLVDEGKLSLDDRLDKFVPDVPNSRNITIRELANMTSGLFNYTEDSTFGQTFINNPLKKWAPMELVNLAISHNPYFEPSKNYYYSNTNTILLGMIVEKITGNNIGDEMKKRIFTPLGMRNTYFATEPSIEGEYCHGYVYESSKFNDITEVDPSNAWSAGAIISTVDDLRIWSIALAEGWLISPAMQKERLTWCGYDDPKGVQKYCSGIYYYRYSNFVGHTGDFPGYTTCMFYLPSKKASFVVMGTNAYGIYETFEELTKLLLPDEVTW